MVTSFSITPVERGIVRCQHTGEFTPEDIQSLASFMLDYRGKLLIDLSGTSGEECSRHIKNFRPMMPTAAIFGAPIDPAILEVPGSYYTHEVKFFNSEEEAMEWLRNQ
ncbi:MAG: STAS/SEC14 domain-containing protein [Anaerolineales bacterium]